jgi:UDP-glucuronate decarboxylase
MIYNSYVNRQYKIFQRLSKKEKASLKDKKILILGTSGFLGLAFVEFFKFLEEELKYNFSIDCYDLKKPFFKNTNKISFFKKDITKINIKKKYDIIIYLAGMASPEIYKKYPLETLSASYEGVKIFLEKSKKDNSKIIIFSSSEIYGYPDKKNVPTKEEYYGYVNSFGPRSCYDEGKRVSETLAYIYKTKFNTKIKIIRPFNVYGPNMPPHDNRVIPKMYKTIAKKKLIEIYSNGKQTRSFCYVDDAMVGFVKICLDNSSQSIYNVGNDKEEMSMEKLAKILKSKFKDNIKIKKIDYPNNYPSDEPLRRCPDISKLKKLNYRPIFKLSEGLDLFIKYYKF